METFPPFGSLKQVCEFENGWEVWVEIKVSKNEVDCVSIMSSSLTVLFTILQEKIVGPSSNSLDESELNKGPDPDME